MKEYVVHLKSMRITAKNKKEALKEVVARLYNGNQFAEEMIEDIEDEDYF